MTEHVPIVISGPAAPETLRVFRGVAASLGAGDISFDRIEELRMAVDEAATMVLPQAPRTPSRWSSTPGTRAASAAGCAPTARCRAGRATVALVGVAGRA